MTDILPSLIRNSYTPGQLVCRNQTMHCAHPSIITRSQSPRRPSRQRELGHCKPGREMFYLTTHSTHFINGYMASDIWLRTILIVRKETCCRHIGYSYRLTARVLLYTPSHRQDDTYHGLCYTSRGALAGTRNSIVNQGKECFQYTTKDRSRQVRTGHFL